ncbi:MAG: twitching motility protein PilU [Methylophilaceae bacterium]|jgi:twitching motility protein PilU
MASFDITPILKLMKEKGGSDLFFSTGAAVHINIEDETIPVNNQVLAPGIIKGVAYSLMSEVQIKEFEETMECNFALSKKDIGRYRVNVYRQRGEVSMVIRHIKTEIPDFASLGLPSSLHKIVLSKRGLVLVVGATDSGKSTTLASMIDHRNSNSSGHIITIEDPIEYMYHHKKSVVDQREVGIDTLSFDSALKNAMRQAPNVILIGEVRDKEGMEQALAYAETGHLCLATLHANNANQALERIVSFFPPESRHSLLLGLSLNLVGVISQRLISGKLKKRVAAVEVLMNTPYIAELIQKQSFANMKDTMADSNDIGMKTFDQALYALYESGQISEENALMHADSRNNLSLKIRFKTKGERVSGGGGFGS